MVALFSIKLLRLQELHTSRSLVQDPDVNKTNIAVDEVCAPAVLLLLNIGNQQVHRGLFSNRLTSTTRFVKMVNG